MLEKANVLTVKPISYKALKHGTKLMTDGFDAYYGLNKNYEHNVINHARGEYVRYHVHTNTIEGFGSRLKRGTKVINHWVSKGHLQSYVDEYALRYNTRKVSTNHRFNLILSNVAGRLTYKYLIA
ncbi:hypothetical protein GCM10008119_16440 [Pedobacter mendelii]|uniref:ISXO2-like transposase domain-containing protein n=1 Tax=Pedobacter mendelii TaxID=1908240 RepID=A0ABQ2BI50_9SPHI|nr:hypothetical protein GCM10008119_16440 [Pedobacter mendelii]